MKRIFSLFGLFLMVAFPALADDLATVEKSGTLLFSDTFERDEPTSDQETIGEGWTSNSAWAWRSGSPWRAGEIRTCSP